MNIWKSKRFWASMIGIGAIVAVQLGVPAEKANEISAAVQKIIELLVGAFAVENTIKAIKG